MTNDRDIGAIQNCVANSIAGALNGSDRIAAVLGENPSVYSKSPRLWNAVFARYGVAARYLPMDVSSRRLGELVAILRASERVLGFNVTVPHKVRIMEYLDSLDAGAARIKAVNLVARTPDGRLIGYNTDGAGFIESILKPQPGRRESFVASLEKLTVLLIGAGGSARAVAFHVADHLSQGELLICNRSRAPAESLAEEIRISGARARAIREAELGNWAVRAGLIINSTIKGQGGMRRVPSGEVVSLEDYSALAPANETSLVAPDDLSEKTVGAAPADVGRNHQRSFLLAQAIPRDVGFYDLVYFPEETVFLRHARMTGHRTMNGRAMIVCQAARGLFDYLCEPELRARGLHTPEIYDEIIRTMYGAW